MPDAGIALRVPTPNVSVVDLVIQTEKKTFAEEVNEAFRESSRGAQKVRLNHVKHGHHDVTMHVSILLVVLITRSPPVGCSILQYY